MRLQGLKLSGLLAVCVSLLAATAIADNFESGVAAFNERDYAKAMSALVTARWGETAPLGWPVVPEV